MTSRMLQPLIAAMAGLVVASHGGAQTSTTNEANPNPLPDKAAELKFNYDVARAQLRKPLKQLMESYRRRLETIVAERQASGDLEAVVSVNNELKLLKEKGDANREPPEGEPSDLVGARRIFVREKDNLERLIVRKEEPLDRTFRENLVLIQEEYTQNGKLAEAVVVTNYLNELPKPGTPLPSTGPRKLTLKLQIDGLSHLYLCGNEMWYDHSNGTVAPPGRHHGDFPTYINDDTEWLPRWNGKVTDRHDAGIGLPTAGPPPKLKLRFIDGRGSADVIEQPTQANDYTVKIEIRDQSPEGRKFAGSSWAEFRLTW